MEKEIVPGQKFGNVGSGIFLTAVSYAGVVNNYRSWLFRCSCGNQKVFAASLVRNGRQRSCGCARMKQRITRNQSGTAIANKAGRLAFIKSRKKAVSTPKELAHRLDILTSLFMQVPKVL